MNMFSDASSTLAASTTILMSAWIRKHEEPQCFQLFASHADIVFAIGQIMLLKGGFIMRGNSCVVKASSIYYWDSNQPDWLYQIAEEYYQQALEYELEYSFQKAKIHYQKAEECFQKARDAYKAKKQAGKAKKQADEARKQADEARKQAGEAREQAGGGYVPQRAARRIYKTQPTAEYQARQLISPNYFQPLTRRQPPPSQNQAPKTGLEKASAPNPRPGRDNKKTPPKDVGQGIQRTDELNPPQPSAVQGVPIPGTPEKNDHRPISWRGRKHG